MAGDPRLHEHADNLRSRRLNCADDSFLVRYVLFFADTGFVNASERSITVSGSGEKPLGFQGGLSDNNPNGSGSGTSETVNDPVEVILNGLQINYGTNYESACLTFWKFNKLTLKPEGIVNVERGGNNSEFAAIKLWDTNCSLIQETGETTLSADRDIWLTGGSSLIINDDDKLIPFDKKKNLKLKTKNGDGAVQGDNLNEKLVIAGGSVSIDDNYGYIGYSRFDN